MFTLKIFSHFKEKSMFKKPALHLSGRCRTKMIKYIMAFIVMFRN